MKEKKGKNERKEIRKKERKKGKNERKERKE